MGEKLMSRFWGESRMNKGGDEASEKCLLKRHQRNRKAMKPNNKTLYRKCGTPNSSRLASRFPAYAKLARRGIAGLLACMVVLPSVPALAANTHPYYQRRKLVPQDPTKFASDHSHIDLTNAHLDPYYDGVSDPVAAAKKLFDARAAAAASDAAGVSKGARVYPNFQMQEDGPHHINDDGTIHDKAGEELYSEEDLLEMKWYGGPGFIYVPRGKCLGVLAYRDFFPNVDTEDLWRKVNEAILAAKPGWCGTVGPDVDDWKDLLWDAIWGNDEATGDYDMVEMNLLHLAYSYYDQLTSEAQEHLITQLLQYGRIHRIGWEDDGFTSGGVPERWDLAGHVEIDNDELFDFLAAVFPPAILGQFIFGDSTTIKDIGETENHILAILTARYLTNQLLYQRHDYHEDGGDFDNRRNGSETEGHYRPGCTDLVLELLRNMLKDDFSEYNAKPYQEQTRFALLNLCTYAYDDEVRLAARMVLDYISAKMVVSSDDLRRMIPFRRRNESDKRRVVVLEDGAMNVGLVEDFFGADPLAPYFALQAGNTRVYEHTYGTVRPWEWGIAGGGNEITMEALSAYRLPPSIHDLFVNDLHRRFFQRLHRKDVGYDHNADNKEIYAGSPSYLITAGGEPATYALDPHIAGRVVGDQDQQKGVAVTTSFMPTGLSAGYGTENDAGHLIQFGFFSDVPKKVGHYGVAPDFACGYYVHLPSWVTNHAELVVTNNGSFLFVDRKSPSPNRPGFYLAIYRQGDFALLEAFDTWLHAELSFADFKQGVLDRNRYIDVPNNSPAEFQYGTQNGNVVHFAAWQYGAFITQIEYGSGDPKDTLRDAGNDTDPFLSGTILRSSGDGVVSIFNPYLGTEITLDMSDKWRPKMITRKNGVEQEREEAGGSREVWVDFNSPLPDHMQFGDFYRPFKTLTNAVNAVAEGGVIKIMPGTTNEKPPITKRLTLVAPIGDVHIGVPE